MYLFRDSGLNIEPTAGDALIFEHGLWHKGTPVQSGHKYVLRTDIVFSPSLGKSTSQ